MRLTCRWFLPALASLVLLPSPTTARPAPAPAAERPWVEVKSPNFTIISDAGEKTARRVAWQFEQVRAVLQRLWPWARVGMDRPVLVYAARNEATLKVLLPEYWETRGAVHPASFFVTAPERHYVALRTDVNEPDSVEANPYFQTYWSYVYLVVLASFEKPLPLWYARGVSDFFANTIVRSKDVQVGRIVPWHFRELRERPFLPLATVLAVDHRSPYMQRNEDMPRFDAAAWGLVHYLFFGEGGNNLQRFNKLSQAFIEGRDAQAALREIYGEADAIEAAVKDYIARNLFLYQKIALDVDVSEEGFRARTITIAENRSAQAALHAAMRRWAEARARAQEAIQADASLAAPHEVEGRVCDAENNKDGALAAYGKAVSLGSTNFHAYYRHAQLLWRPSPDADTLAQMERSLTKAVELNASFASAASYLADIKLSLDQPDAALVLARRAVSLEPGGSYHHATLAQVLGRLSKIDEALQEANKALTLATTVDARKRAEDTLARLNKMKK